MRNLSTGKLIKLTLVFAIALILALAMIMTAFTLPIKNNAAAEQNTIKPDFVAPPTEAASTVIGSAGNQIEVLGADQVSGLEDGDVPGGSIAYITNRGYREDSLNWTPINNAKDLKAWLKNDGGKNAYLVNNIERFDWRFNDSEAGGAANGPEDTSQNATFGAAGTAINYGRTFDGCGYTVNLQLSNASSGNRVDYNSGVNNNDAKYVGVFVQHIYGTLKNTKFTYKTVSGPSHQDVKVYAGSYSGVAANVFFGLIAGRVGTNDSSKTAIVENLSLEMKSDSENDENNRLHIECAPHIADKVFNKQRQNATMRFGCMFGQLMSGVLRNCTAVLNGGNIYMNIAKSTSDKEAIGYLHSGIILACYSGDHTINFKSFAYNLSVIGSSIKMVLDGSGDRQEGSFGGAIGYIYGNNYIGSNGSLISGMYVESDTSYCAFNANNYSGEKKPKYMYIGLRHPNIPVTLYQGTMYTKGVSGTRSDESAMRIPQNYGIRFAKPDPAGVDGGTLTPEEYYGKFAKVILNDTGAKTSSQVFWELKRYSHGTAKGCLDMYYEFIGASPDAYVSLPTKFDDFTIGTDIKNTLEFTYGTKVQLTEIPSQENTYNGNQVVITGQPTLTGPDGTFTAIDGAYTIMYNGSATAPTLPSDNSYKITLAVDGVLMGLPEYVNTAQMSYLDMTNRIAAPARSDIYGTLKINKAKLNLVSVTSDGVPYDGNNYISKPVNYETNIEGLAAEPAGGFRAAYQERVNGVYGDWSEQVSGTTVGITPSDGLNKKNKDYRIQVYAELNGSWIAVTEYLNVEPFLFDNAKPTVSYSSAYTDGSWWTSDSPIVISPTAFGRAAKASAEAQIVRSDGSVIKDWFVADNKFETAEGYVYDGFQITSADAAVEGTGKVYFKIRGITEAGVLSDEILYTVLIDTRDYTVNYQVQLKDGTALQDNIVTLNGVTTFKRSEHASFVFTTSGGAEGYYIAEVNATKVNNLTEFNYTYMIPFDMPIGGTPENVTVKVRKGAALSFAAAPSVTYGDAISLPQPIVSGKLNEADDLGIAVDFVTEAVGTRGVGTHEFTATITNDNYIATVTNGSLTITKRELYLDIVAGLAGAYRFKLTDYTDDKDAFFGKLNLNLKSDAIIAGDDVSILSVSYYSDKEATIPAVIDKFNAYYFKATINNENYKLADSPNNIGMIVITMLDYDKTAGAYLLKSAEDFYNLNDFPGMLTQNLLLTTDIDLGAYDNAAIKGEYKGIFDGGNHRISTINLISFEETQYGLFYKLGSGAVVKNLVIDNMSIGIHTANTETVNTANVGMLAGEMNGAAIENVIIRGELRVTSTANNVNVGGVAGKAVDSRIVGVAYLSTLDVNAKNGIVYGGIVGEAVNTVIENIEFIGVTHINTAAVSAAKYGYITASDVTANGVTVTNAKFIEGSLRFMGNKTAAEAGAPGIKSTYGAMASAGVVYAGVNYSELLKGSVDPRYFGPNVYGTGADDAFVINNYNQLVATVIYPYATFKLGRNIICQYDNVFNAEEIFGSIIMNGYKITDINGALIAE